MIRYEVDGKGIALETKPASETPIVRIEPTPSSIALSRLSREDLENRTGRSVEDLAWIHVDTKDCLGGGFASTRALLIVALAAIPSLAFVSRFGQAGQGTAA